MSERKKRRLNETSLSIPGQDLQGLADDMAKSLFCEATADIILKVQDDRLPAHRAILATRCEYFRAMLYGGMQESIAKEVQIDDDYSPAIMRHLLRYIYTQQIGSLTLEDAVPLMACADRYGMNKLQYAIRCQMTQSLSKDNVIEVLVAAVKHHQELFVEKCLDFVAEEASEVLMSESFLQLDAPTALRILQAAGMGGKSLACLRAAIKWREGRASREAESPAGHHNTSEGEMCRYIDAATVQLIDQLGSWTAAGMQTRPATIVRRTAVQDRWLDLGPAGPRTRVTVLHMKKDGPAIGIFIKKDDLALLFPNGSITAGAATRAEPLIKWSTGKAVDIAISTSASGYQVSVRGATDRPAYTFTAAVKPQVLIKFCHIADEVLVEHMH